MKCNIFNRLSGVVQFTAEIDCAEDAPASIKIGLAVRWAVKNNANLSGADLSGADLSGADLSGANLTCTDLDQEATVSTPATIRGYGAVTVPVATLQGIAAKLEAGSQVELQADNKLDHAPLALASGRAKFTLPRLPVADFPAMTGTGPVRRITLAPGHLRRMIEVCHHAISSEETRYYLCGIHLHRAPGSAQTNSLRAVATDGHQLAAFDVPADGPVPDDWPPIIVPRAVIDGLRKQLKDQADPVDIAVTDNTITLRLSALTVTSKLIDGTFPDYERVIPRDNPDRLTVTTAVLARAVDRVGAVTTDKSRAVKLLATAEACTVSARTAETDQQAEDTLDPADFQLAGRPVEIGFNGRYLAALLDAAETDRLDLHFDGAASPVLATIPGDGGLRLVLMPMRV